jgi:hypothetical protein
VIGDRSYAPFYAAKMMRLAISFGLEIMET